METYIYRHRRNDTDKIFYVGKGRGNRPWVSNKRNDYWKSIVAKHGYTVEIVAYGLDDISACMLERELIKVYKTKNQCEANFTLGGDGRRVEKNTAEHNQKIRDFGLSDKHPMRGKTWTDEQKQNLKESRIGEDHPKFKGWYFHEDKTYTSIREASEDTGISKTTLQRWTKTNRNGWSFEEK